MKIQLLFIFILLSLSPVAFAKKFQTEYVSFDLLNNWNCHAEGTEWICKNKLNNKKTSEALIMLTAKEKGPSDTLAEYMQYLKIPKTVSKLNGGNFTSKVVHVKQRQIQDHSWIDGFHQGSEVPVYHTRYLVTIKGHLAILVTYSAHKNHYTKYASDFAKSINSLRVMNVSKGFAAKHKGSIGIGAAQDYLQDMIDAESELGGSDEGFMGGDPNAKGKGGLIAFFKTAKGISLLFLMAIATYWFIKKKKQAKKRKKR